LSDLRRLLRVVLAAAVAAGLVVAGSALFGGGDEAEKAPRPPAVRQATPGGLPTDFVGLTADDVFAGGRAYRDRTLTELRDIGVGLIRQTFDWSRIEIRPLAYDFSAYDGFVAAAAEHGIRVLPILFNPPRFRSSAPATGADQGTYPPRSAPEMADFAAAAVARYGPNGTLWTERPDVPKLPIRSWQVWNEPNVPAYWASGPDPGEYARLLAEAGRAIKQVDPEAEVVTAGIPESRLGIPAPEFIARLYRAGAKGSFDALGLHPYARDAAGSLDAVRATRRLMDAAGDRSPIWVTEFGWASGGPESPFTVSPDGQAERIRASIAGFGRVRRALRLRGFAYFSWKDGAVFQGGSDFFGLYTGLLDRSGEPKPGFEAFKDAVAEVER
jgi:hypothetical protein